MYKLVLIVAMMSVWLTMQLQQIEHELAMKTLFQGKHAINRAAHAAAQQLDIEALGNGVMAIDSEAAAIIAAQYLQVNLRLDENGDPLQDSFLRNPVEVLVFEVVNADRTFPYSYRNDTYDYEVELLRPGVVLIAKVVYPRAFRLTDEIEWEIKGAAELIVNG